MTNNMTSNIEKSGSKLSKGVVQSFERGCVKALTVFRHTYERGWFIGMNGGGSYLLPIFDKPIILGRYSPSQNGIVVSPKGIVLCLAGGFESEH